MIYLQLVKQPDSLVELFSELYSYSNGHELHGVRTYHDPECTKVQCDENKWRSIDDCFEIAKTYFPDTTIEEVVKAILEFPKLKGKYLRPYSCGAIERVNFYVTRNILDENGFTSILDRQRSSIYSWRELFKMVGIESYKDLLAYYK